MGDIFIRYVNMSLSVPAVTQIDSNGDYNVYINARLGYARQQQAKEHELRHITGDHFYRNSPVTLDEAEAELKPILNQPQSNIKPVQQYTDLRKQKGFSAYQAAKLLGISTSRYVRIEQGLCLPTSEEKQRIEDFYK